jgi:hypothetical protein
VIDALRVNQSDPSADRGGGHPLRPFAFNTNVLKQVATEIENVKAEYVGVVSEESIDLIAGESLQKLAGSKVPQFVPLFVGRFTRERLRELTGLRPRARFSLLTKLGAGDLRPPPASTGAAFVPTIPISSRAIGAS